MKRVAIWAGVSSKPQARDDKFSLETQIAEGEELCQQKGWDVVARLIVPGVTRFHLDLPDAIASVDEALAKDTSGLFERRLAELRADGQNAYRRLAELIEGRKIDVLVCYRRDRLGRTDSLVSHIEGQLRRIGASVWSLYMPPTGSEEADLYLSAVERANLQHYVIRLVDATRRGMDNRASRGLLLAGPVPFGYREDWKAEGDGLTRVAVVNEREAEAYRWAVAETLAGDMRQIDIIDRMRDRFPERRWSPSALRGMLRSPFYMGLVLRRRTRTDRDRSTLVVAGELDHARWPEVEGVILSRAQGDTSARGNSRSGPKVYVVSVGRHEPLLDVPTWLDLQALLDGRSKSRRPTSGRGLWSGILFCGVCGQRMYTDARLDKKGREYVNYRCGSRQTGQPCGNKAVSERKATYAVGQHLRAVLAAYTPDEDQKDTGAGWSDERVRMLEREAKETGEEHSRLILLFKTGRIDLDEFDALRAETAAKAERLDAELRGLKEKRVSRERRVGRLAVLGELLPDLEGRLLAAPADEANGLLRQIFEAIHLVNGEVVSVELG